MFSAIFTQLLLVTLVWAALASKPQLKNAVDILLANNPAENIGAFWYLQSEMFANKLQFMKPLFVLEQLVMCCFISIHLSKTFDIIQNFPKAEQLSRSLFLNGILLIGFVKHEMNTYPSLHELSLLVLICIVNKDFIMKYMEPYLVFVLAVLVLYSIWGMSALWLTWLNRFSGNANFFWFQTLAYNSFIVLIFI